MKTILERIKKLFSKEANLVDGNEYGYLGNIFLVDQLCSPDKTKVSSDLNNINDPEAAARYGTKDIKEYSFWARRSCGIAILYSILKTFKSFNGSIYDLVLKAEKADGYIHENDLGWKHQAIVDILKENNIESSIVKQITVNELISEIIKENIFIASVKSRNSGSHMILVYKIKKINGETYISVLDPWNLDGKGGLVEMKTNDFEDIFLQRGILVNKI